MCRVRVKIDWVLVTAMAASTGHWLTVYVPGELSYSKQEQNIRKTETFLNSKKNRKIL